MYHLIELIVDFFTVWPGSRGPDSMEKRKVAAGCLLMILILIGLIVGVYYAVT